MTLQEPHCTPCEEREGTWTRNMERRMAVWLSMWKAPTPLNSTIFGCRSCRSTAQGERGTAVAALGSSSHCTALVLASPA